MNKLARPGTLEFLVEQHYEPLYRFALKLSNNPSDARDLTQQAFYVAQTKGHQLRRTSKVRTWLATTLRRLFLQRCRHEQRFPKHELAEVEYELPPTTMDPGARLDAQAALAALDTLEERFRLPLALYYLEDRTYREVARALNTPIGTVMSRMARGRSLLRQRLENGGRSHGGAPSIPSTLHGERASTTLSLCA